MEKLRGWRNLRIEKLEDGETSDWETLEDCLDTGGEILELKISMGQLLDRTLFTL